MKAAIFAGPAGGGKTQLIKRLLPLLGGVSMIAKTDTLAASEERIFERLGFGCEVILSGDYCPDHIGYISFPNVFKRAAHRGAEFLLLESAGLCGRCVPFLIRTGSFCVMPATSYVAYARKMSAMLKEAGNVVLTKCDAVTMSERKVLKSGIHDINPCARIFECNNLTGEGARAVAEAVKELPDRRSFIRDHVAGRPPKGNCSLCQEEY